MMVADGHAGHVPVEARYKPHVQHNVQQAGDDEENHRGDGISQATQHAGEDVVKGAAR